MKGDDRHSAARTEHFKRAVKSSLQLAQLVVDCDPQSLKGFSRRVTVSSDSLRNVCFDDLMLFTKIYGNSAEVRSITVCMLNTIRNNKEYYCSILKDDDARASFVSALSRVTEEATGSKGSSATLSLCSETMKKWANENFRTSVDDIYKEWISNLPLKSVLKGKELEDAIKAFEANTIEDFRKRVK